MQLTEEMIDQMEAGPEMNALIEARIFGATPLTLGLNYSADEGALSVLIYHLGKHYNVGMQITDGVTTYSLWPQDYWSHREGWHATSKDCSLAICRAALKTTLEN